VFRLPGVQLHSNPAQETRSANLSVAKEHKPIERCPVDFDFETLPLSHPERNWVQLSWEYSFVFLEREFPEYYGGRILNSEKQFRSRLRGIVPRH
jgi:hypothetical protein